MDERDNLIFDSRPALRSPYILCGLNGWVNGGDVSAGGIEYLIKQLRAEKFAEFPVARYHLYQVPGVENLRPMFKMQDGVIVEARFPKNEFYYATNPASDHDIIFFLGAEPSLNWEEYADTVLTLAGDFGASRLITFGGILDRSPYTRQPRISCTCTSVKVKNEMQKYNVTFSSREGPASFNLMLLRTCQKRGLDGLNLTVRAPYYPEFNVAIDYSPKSVKAVLVRLAHMMNLDVNFEELNKTITELEGKLDFIRQQNPQFNTYVEELEKNYVEMPYQEPLDISANEAIKFAEEFLRQHKDRPHGQ
ncbi:MAG: PAC2 family protein [Chloroflexi bacterium]|nr:PAC2 family protein [Chloroflexota bacterium]